MANTKLSEKSIDRADLRAAPAAAISQLGCIDVIVAIRHQYRNGGKPVDDLVAGFRSG